MPITKLFTPILVAVALGACASSSEKAPAPVEDVAIPETSTVTPVEPQPIVQEQAPEPEPVILETVVYFEFDKSQLTADAKAVLRQHAQRLSANPKNIRIEGHSDERGPSQYNLSLGQRRANAVRDFLISNGVSASRIETISFGEQNPQSDGNYEAAWQQNRRVELKL